MLDLRVCIRISAAYSSVCVYALHYLLPSLSSSTDATSVLIVGLVGSLKSPKQLPTNLRTFWTFAVVLAVEKRW